MAKYRDINYKGKSYPTVLEFAWSDKEKYEDYKSFLTVFEVSWSIIEI